MTCPDSTQEDGMENATDVSKTEGKQNTEAEPASSISYVPSEPYITFSWNLACSMPMNVGRGPDESRTDKTKIQE